MKVSRDFLREMDSEEETANYDMVTRGGARSTATQFHEQTGLPNLEDEKYLIKSLAYEVPRYHDYYDREKLPAGTKPFRMRNGRPVINRGERFCRHEEADGTLCGIKVSRRYDLIRHAASHYGYDPKDFSRLPTMIDEAELHELEGFYGGIMREPKAKAQKLEPAAPAQKRKRATSSTSEDKSDEDEGDAEAVTEAFKKRSSRQHRSTTREVEAENDEELLISGAIPNDEVLYEPVDDDDDFIRSRAPSLSSIGTEVHSRVDSVATAAPKKRGAFFST